MSERQTDSDQLPEIVQDWAEIISQRAIKLLGLAPDQARALGAAAVMDITDQYGGRQFYLTVGMMAHLNQRDLDIAAAFNGYNYAELAATYKCSERHIRRLLNRAAAVRQLANQADMFGGREAPDRSGYTPGARRKG